MLRQGQLAVHGLAILLGRNEAGINRGKFFLPHAVVLTQRLGAFFLVFCLLLNVFQCPEGRYLLNDPKLSGF